MMDLTADDIDGIGRFLSMLQDASTESGVYFADSHPLWVGGRIAGYVARVDDTYVYRSEP